VCWRRALLTAVTRSCALRAPPTCAAPAPRRRDVRASQPNTFDTRWRWRAAAAVGAWAKHTLARRGSAPPAQEEGASPGAQEHRSTAIVAATLRSFYLHITNTCNSTLPRAMTGNDAAEFLYVCRTCTRVRPRTGRSTRRQAKEFYARRCVYPLLPPPRNGGGLQSTERCRCENPT
jgi:hypothetical protein